ncbi:MAG: hypothetical protein NXI27_30240 [Alphaproteobacteria bacterium]|jgi:MFS family permease|nr:hypothetical protein [Alphaproteobacteria bacterium]
MEMKVMDGRKDSHIVPEQTKRCRTSLALVIIAKAIGIWGCLALLILGIMADENSGIILAAVILGLATLVSLSAAVRLRGDLANRKTDGRMLLLYASGINLLVFGIPVLLGTYAATVFGFGIASQDDGVIFGLSLIAMAALGLLFFITHISAFRIAWSLKPKR